MAASATDQVDTSPVRTSRPWSPIGTAHTTIRVAIRALDRILPPWLLSRFLLPIAIGIAALRPPTAQERGQWDRLPEAWRPRARCRWGAAIGEALDGLAWMCRDRFRKARWRRRVTTRGLERLGRPSVLATLHFGPMAQIARRLCASGVPAGILALDPSRLSRRHAGGCPGAPRIFGPSDLRAAHEFLEGGGVLVAAMDVPRGVTHEIPFEGRSLRLANVALRLAAPHRAPVHPCIGRRAGPWRYEIHFGEPVPGDAAADRSQDRDSLERLVRSMVPIIRRCPEQAHEVLRLAFVPAAQKESWIDSLPSR